jgi:hypothetical protein
VFSGLNTSSEVIEKKERRRYSRLAKLWSGKVLDTPFTVFCCKIATSLYFLTSFLLPAESLHS